jgi:hypothetical protein
MKTIFKTLCALSLLCVWMLPGESEYELAKKQERLTAEFWTADGKHYSGIEE